MKNGRPLFVGSVHWNHIIHEINAVWGGELIRIRASMSPSNLTVERGERQVCLYP